MTDTNYTNHLKNPGKRSLYAIRVSVQILDKQSTWKPIDAAGNSAQIFAKLLLCVTGSIDQFDRPTIALPFLAPGVPLPSTTPADVTRRAQ